jgi:hypothetical protein
MMPTTEHDRSSRDLGRAGSGRAASVVPAFVGMGLCGMFIAVAAVLLLPGTGEPLSESASESTEYDLAGNPVRVETPPPTGTTVSIIPGARFRVPAVGLDVPLDRIRSVDGDVVPPGFTDAYLIDGIGVDPDDAADGTVFVVMHSVRGEGVGPGDYLMDANGSSALARGSTITVDGVHFVVESATTLDKSQLATTGEVWRSVPGRLVVITCQQNAGDSPSTRNLVIEARAVP